MESTINSQQRTGSSGKSSQARRIIFSTEAKGLVSGTMTPAEAAQQKEIMAVVLAQPHRPDVKGSRGSELRRFVSDRGYGEHLVQAGEQYEEIVRQDRRWNGIKSPGIVPGLGDLDILTDQQMKAKKDLAASRRREAESILRQIKLRLPGVVERIACDDLAPFPNDEGILAAGLVKLALEWGFLKRRFGDE